MALDEKSKLLTFDALLACHTVRNVVGFLFLERLQLFQILKMTKFHVAPEIRENAAILA